MDKFDQRKSQSQILFHRRLGSAAFFSLIFIVQAVLFFLLSKFSNLAYAVFLCLFLDFGYGLQAYSRELFIRQIRDALLDMENAVPVGRVMLYKMPVSSEVGSSYIWDSIRARVLYRYRYHRRSFDFNFIPADSSDPASCAWSAAWFLSITTLYFILVIPHCSSSPFFSADTAFSTILFPIVLGSNGSTLTVCSILHPPILPIFGHKNNPVGIRQHQHCIRRNL